MPTRAAQTDATRRVVRKRILSIQDEIRRAREYLRSGGHAAWAGFRPLFRPKRKADKDLPPHKDWVQNVFLPQRERSLIRAEKLLERLG